VEPQRHGDHQQRHRRIRHKPSLVDLLEHAHARLWSRVQQVGTPRDDSANTSEQLRQMTTHRYNARCHWRGDTGVGWENYDRAHSVEAPPATQRLTVTTGEALGDPAQLNPEQLLVMAASSCQLLWFLHVAAKARIDVIEYEDEAAGEMPEDDLPVRVTRIVLRPRIVVRDGPSTERVEQLVHLAHEHCYIAKQPDDRGGARAARRVHARVAHVSRAGRR